MKTLTLILLFLVIGCGKQDDTTATSKVSLILSSILDGSPGDAMYGGAMFLGRMIDGNSGSEEESFSIVLNRGTNDIPDLSLQNGKWEFALIAWDGTTLNHAGEANRNMMGVMRCGRVENELIGDLVTLNFNISVENCREDKTRFSENEIFAKYDQYNGASMKALVLKSCYDVDSTASLGMECDGGSTPIGSALSYRVFYESDINIEGNRTNLIPLTSACFNTASGEIMTDIILPFGDESYGMVGSIKIRAFDAVNCGGNQYDYKFSDTSVSSPRIDGIQTDAETDFDASATSSIILNLESNTSTFL